MTKNISLMIVTGSLLIITGLIVIYIDYQNQNNPLDQVSISEDDLDNNDEFLPLLQEINKTIDENDAPTLQIATNEIALGAGLENGYIPERIVISSIGVDAKIDPIQFKEILVNGKTYQQWMVPNEKVVGWHETSALLGMKGNTVLNGHHNVFGKVFGELVKLVPGDIIQIYTGEKIFQYLVVEKMLLPERYQNLTDRMENARWISTSDDERITLISCWPADSNTHRVVIIAFPIISIINN